MSRKKYKCNTCDGNQSVENEKKRRGARDEFKTNDKKNYCCSAVNINAIDSVTDEL